MKKGVKKFLEYLYNEAIILKRQCANEYIENVMKSGSTKFSLDFTKNQDVIKRLEKKYIDNGYVYDYEVLNSLIYFMELSETQEYNVEVFCYFDILSKYLVKSGLNSQEMFDVVTNIFNLNIRANILSGCDLLDLEAQENFEYEGIEKGYYPTFMRSKEFKKIMTSDDLSEEEMALRDFIFDYYTAHAKPNDTTVCHNLIKKHLLDRMDNYTKKDIKVLDKVFEHMKFTPEVQAILINYLTKKMNKRINKNSELDLNIKKEEKKEFDQKTYNKIYHEISTMYDLEREVSIVPLNTEQIMYLISLMLKINIDNRVIKKFIKNQYNAYNTRDEKVNPLTYFSTFLYSKMEYYSDDEEVCKSLETIKNYLQEMMIVNNEDYAFWKDEVKNEINKAYKLLIHEVDYDFELAKKRRI